MTTFGALEENIVVTSIFFFSQNVFDSMKDNFNILSNIWFVVCKFFQFGQT